MWVNVGAIDRTTGMYFPIKKLLLAKLRTRPADVGFELTSNIAGPTGLPQYFTIKDVKPGMNLTVCGPDPYIKRKWYAMVSVVNGIIKAK